MNQMQYNNLVVAISKVSFVMDDLRLFLDTHPAKNGRLSTTMNAQKSVGS